MKHYIMQKTIVNNKYIAAGGKALTVIITLAIYTAIAMIVIALWLLLLVWLIGLFI